MRRVNHPMRGANHPMRGVNHPIRGANHPIRKVDHPIRKDDHPIRKVDHPIGGANHPIKGGQPPHKPDSIYHPELHPDRAKVGKNAQSRQSKNGKKCQNLPKRMNITFPPISMIIPIIRTTPGGSK